MKPDKTIDLALKYLGLRPRTSMEMRIYLEKKGRALPEVNKAIEWLQDEGYLDDRKYAMSFLENRKRYKPKAAFALGYELSQKGISKKIRDELIEAVDDQEMANLAIEQKLRSWKHLAPDTCKKKLLNYLRYRGFGYGICQVCWSEVSQKLFPEKD